MIIDILGLFGGAVSSLPVRYVSDADGLSPDIVSGEVVMEGEARNFAGYVVLFATITVKAQVICARCGCVYDTEFSIDIENKLTDKLENEDNDEFILVENGLFDVSEFVQGSITLELPSRFMCSEDCKGLCPKCGHNLNESLCSCDKREIDPRLAILSEYFGDE